MIPHTGLGLLSIGVAGGRLLELRFAPEGGRIAGLVSLTAMLLVGALLVFYHEPRAGADVAGRTPENAVRFAGVIPDDASMTAW